MNPTHPPRKPPGRRAQERPWAAGFQLRGPGNARPCSAPGGGRPGCRRRRGSSREHLPAPLLAQSPGPGRGAQVLGGGVGPAWAGGALIVPGWLRSSAAGGREGSPPLGSRLFFTPLRTRRVPRPRQQQARRRGGCGGGGGGGVCARLAFPPPRLGERGGGEGRAEAGISQLGPQGPKRGTRCSFPPHCAL